MALWKSVCFSAVGVLVPAGRKNEITDTIHTYIRAYTQTFTHTYIHTYRDRCMHAYINTVIHTQTQIYTNAYMRAYNPNPTVTTFGHELHHTQFSWPNVLLPTELKGDAPRRHIFLVVNQAVCTLARQGVGAVLRWSHAFWAGHSQLRQHGRQAFERQHCRFTS